jgi:hypothetical protein
MQSDAKKRAIVTLPLVRTIKNPTSPEDSNQNSSSNKQKTPLFQPDMNILAQCPVFQSREAIFQHNISQQITRIMESEQEKLLFVELLRQNFCSHPQIDLRIFNSENFSPFLERQFAINFPQLSLKSLAGLRVAAVDGGLGQKSFIGLQFTLIKTAIVTYEFQHNGKPQISEFRLHPNQENYIFYTDMLSLSEQFGSQLAGLRRQIAENTLVLRYLQENPVNPDILILDGGLLPPSLHFSSEQSILEEAYRLCLLTYRDLFRVCSERKILLIGSVKDTHSEAMRNLLIRAFPTFLKTYSHLEIFRDILYKQIFQRFCDAELIYKLIPPQYRTCLFRYDLDVPLPHRFAPILKTAGESDPIGIYATYFQFSPFDLPTRFEILGFADRDYMLRNITLLEKLLPPLCQMIPDCTLPVPQLEVHQRAHIPTHEMDMLLGQCRREFQMFEMQAFTKKESIVDSKHEAVLTELFTKSYDFRNMYGPFLSKRHDRMPF